MATLMLLGLLWLHPAVAQAPAIVSVTPADGSTGVAIDTPVVITFDRDMDTSVFVFGSLGNLSMSPATLGSTTSGTWGSDRRTLTLQLLFGKWPLNVTIAWTLNPDGANPLFQIKGADGTPLKTVSGSFATGLGAPGLGSVFPKEGAEAVKTNATVTFNFTQPMKKVVLPGGPSPAVVWTGAGLDPARFVYVWSADGRHLSVNYTGGFPLKTEVGWALNPVGATTPLVGESGKPLASATYQGSFKTASVGSCDAGPQFPTWGSYGMNLRSNFRQDSTADPVEETEPGAFVFSAVVQSPAFGPAVTGGKVVHPDGSSSNLVGSAFSPFAYYITHETESEMFAAHPVGTYTLQFTQSGQPERVIPMTLSAGDLPPVPKITNFQESQSIDPSKDFALRWNAFSNGDADDLISLFLSNEDGDIVFFAPNLCVPIPLVPGDTSIAISAGTLLPNRTYSAELLFGKSFYSSTNAVAEMSGYGFWLRGTHFSVKTGGGTVPSDPASISGVHVTSGGKASFSIQGAPGATYGIQRAESLGSATWPEVGTLQTDASGAAVFESSVPLGNAPQWYRAVAR